MRYEAAKGKRIKSRFMGVTNYSDYWWSDDRQRWEQGYQGGYGGTNFDECRTVKAFKRRMKQWSKYLPAGIEFHLISRWIGYSVYAHTRKRKERVHG